MSRSLPISIRQFERYSMPEAEQKLSAVLELVWYQQMQDWDLTNANAEFLSSLFPFLRQQDISDDERFSAMALTVASVDELFMVQGIRAEVWEQLEALLLCAPELHASTIWYWALPALRGEEPYPVSPLMAELWRRVEPGLMFSPSVQPTLARTLNFQRLTRAPK